MNTGLSTSRPWAPNSESACCPLPLLWGGGPAERGQHLRDKDTAAHAPAPSLSSLAPRTAPPQAHPGVFFGNQEGSRPQCLLLCGAPRKWGESSRSPGEAPDPIAPCGPPRAHMSSPSLLGPQPVGSSGAGGPTRLRRLGCQSLWGPSLRTRSPGPGRPGTSTPFLPAALVPGEQVGLGTHCPRAVWLSG